MKPILLTRYILLAIGIPVLLATFLLGRNTWNFIQNSEKITGKVVAYDSHPNVDRDPTDVKLISPVVEFKANNETIKFVSKLNDESPKYKIGDQVPVLYQKDHPEKAQINDFYLLWRKTILAAAFGFVLTLIGVILYYRSKRSDKKKILLKKHGVLIEAKFEKVKKASSKFMQKFPYHIIATWTDPATSKEHLFESDYIWFDPSDYIKGKKIMVYADKNNLNKYYMDIDFLPDANDVE